MARGRPSTGVRQAVLDATLDALRAHGPGRLTTKEVARRAGVAESSIFYHFGGKHELLLAAVQTLTLNLSAGDDPVMLGRALERFYLDALPAMVAVQADSELRERLRLAGHELSVDHIVGQVADHLRGLPAGLDPRVAALLLVGACHQRALHRYSGGSDDQMPTIEAIVDTFVR